MIPTKPIPFTSGPTTHRPDHTIAQPVHVLVPEALLLFGLITILYLLPSAGLVVFFALSGYALCGPKQTIQALTVLFLVSNLNPQLFHLAPSVASMRWMVLFSAFGRVIWDGLLGNRPWPTNLLFPLGVYILAIAVLSLTTSRIPIISFFKLTAFAVGAVTLLTAHYRTVEQKEYWESWYVTFFLIVILSSLVFLRSSAAYLGANGGFKGILVHPQTLGPISAPITAWLMGRLVFHGCRYPIVLVSILLGLFTMFLSEARTALFMFAGALFVTGCLAFVKGLHLPVRPIPRRSAGKRLFIALSLMVLATAGWDTLIEKATMFLLKSEETNIHQGAASFQARTQMVDEQLANFTSRPLTGIGFGVPSNEDAWVRVQSGFLGIPTSYTTEKGFLPSAVLEETGLIGAVLIVCFGFMLLKPLLHATDYAYTAAMLSCILVNVGEMAFFSFGAYGLYFWLILAFSYSVTSRYDNA